MKIQSLFVVSVICFFCTCAFAESGAVATGLCKDGTSYTGASKKGACRGHKGIKEWFGDKSDATASSPAPAIVAAAPTPAASTGEPATGLCKDGTAYTGASKKGACRGHKGIKEWYADKQTPATSVAAPAAVAAAPTPAASTGEPATGLCKDGTAYTGASKRGACRGHKGIKEWYADKQAPANVAAPAASAPAAAPVLVPADGIATGLCKDGTSYTGASKRGACRGHKGIQEWYADKKFPDAKAVAPVQATPAVAPAQTTNSAPSAAPAAAQPMAPAAGSGKVWVNTRSKIYHCEGSKFFGKTKEGEYMSEADAKAKGFNANRKKVCN